jgi:acetylornithine deacetylase/succinyl-diaminopimelate desuccinylase family protein
VIAITRFDITAAYSGKLILVMDPAIKLLRDLVAINSVNPTLVPGAPGEREMADAVATAMRRIGLEVSIEDAGGGRPNVVGVLESRVKGPALMFCGHTDTVGVTGMRDPFTPIERDGRLYGRGAQDMKGGVAAMIDAARVVAEQGGPAAGRLIVAAVVDEEHSSIGADTLVKTWRADAGVVTEPTDLAVAIGHKGFAWIEVDVIGKAAHGSRPADGIDAIVRLGRVLTRLEALDRELQSRAPHARMGTASLHASFVEGGHELSSYPDRARLTLERRTLPSEADAAPLDEVEQILHALAREDASFRATARSIFSRPAYELPAGHMVPRLLGEAFAAKIGRSVSVVGASFWTDAAVLGHAGTPSVLFGPGGAGLHSVEEYVNVADVLACRDVLAELASRFGQAAGGGAT